MNMLTEERFLRLTDGRRIARTSRRVLAAFGLAISIVFGPGAAHAALDAALIRNAVVYIEADVPSDAFTADVLGTEREGSGVVIGKEGLILTIGYVMLEASRVIVTDSEGRQFPADPLAYDFETGFGLVRALPPFAAEPVTLGNSDGIALDDPLLALAAGEPMTTSLVARRTYAGYWEYLLEDALFTAPPHSNFGGAALFDREGDLVGIGSLNLPDHIGDGSGDPANMFVPVNALKPILDDLIATGRRSGPPRPWLGF
ncbi:MAG: S1C family serine protease, partial [Pseudomonadota bacterium]